MLRYKLMGLFFYDMSSSGHIDRDTGLESLYVGIDRVFNNIEIVHINIFSMPLCSLFAVLIFKSRSSWSSRPGWLSVSLHFWRLPAICHHSASSFQIYHYILVLHNLFQNIALSHKHFLMLLNHIIYRYLIIRWYKVENAINTYPRILLLHVYLVWL